MRYARNYQPGRWIVTRPGTKRSGGRHVIVSDPVEADDQAGALICYGLSHDRLAPDGTTVRAKDARGADMLIAVSGPVAVRYVHPAPTWRQ